MANIFALHKKGALDQAENYRPISLTSVCFKMLEHIVYSCICNYLDENNIITPKKHGFRTGYSCESQLILALNDWAHTLDVGSRTDVAIFDFSKAFDKVSHNHLLAKLSHMGIMGQNLNWISAFLTHCTQRVVLNGSKSIWAPVESGVPQGTVLVPLLFSLYINDITESITSDIRLFADDCILYRCISSIGDCIALQHDIDTLLAWSNTWKMHFNPSKCQVMSVTRQRKGLPFVYRLGEVVLPCVASFTYLGVVISSDLCWNLHTDMVKAKATYIDVRRI